MQVKTIDKLIILLYNLLLVAGASYLVYYKDASAWLFVVAIIFAGSWSEKDKE
jgi:uncharacterized membrane protein